MAACVCVRVFVCWVGGGALGPSHRAEKENTLFHRWGVSICEYQSKVDSCYLTPPVNSGPKR